jgi:hypothetical protein
VVAQVKEELQDAAVDGVPEREGEAAGRGVGDDDEVGVCHHRAPVRRVGEERDFAGVVDPGT